MFEITNPAIAALAVAAGLFILVYAGDFLVHGSVGLATRYDVPPLLIGLTIVAFGTSAPELFISVQAVLADREGLAVGNIVGSNIANILLVLGIPSIIAPTICKEPGLRRNVWIMLSVTAVFIYLCETGPIGTAEAALLLGLLSLFLAYSAFRAMTADDDDPLFEEVAEFVSEDGTPLKKVFGLIALGILGLPIGAALTVEGGTALALSIGVDEAVIGLSLVAIGTSLPELATTVAAALRRSAGVAMGNVIGSNIFNLLAVMGVAALFAEAPGIEIPIEFQVFDLWVMLAASLLIVPFTQFHLPIGRLTGIGFLLLYGAYMFVLFNLGRADMGLSSGSVPLN